MLFHYIVKALPWHEGTFASQVSDSLNTQHVVAIGTTSGVVTAGVALVDPNNILPWLQVLGLALGSIASAVSILLAIVKWNRGDKQNGRD